MRPLIAPLALAVLACTGAPLGDTAEEHESKDRDEADADADSDSDSDADSDSDSDADPLSEAACGPWAAIAEGRSWTYAFTESSELSGEWGQSVTNFSGSLGTMEGWGEYDSSAGSQTYEWVRAIACDDGLYMTAYTIDSTYAGDTYRTEIEYLEPVLLFPAALAVGDTYTQDFDYVAEIDGNRSEGRYTIEVAVVAEEEIETGIGPFSALKLRQVYDSGTETTTSEVWVARDVSVVAGTGWEIVEFDD